MIVSPCYISHKMKLGSPTAENNIYNKMNNCQTFICNMTNLIDIFREHVFFFFSFLGVLHLVRFVDAKSKEKVFLIKECLWCNLENNNKDECSSQARMILGKIIMWQKVYFLLLNLTKLLQCIACVHNVFQRRILANCWWLSNLWWFFWSSKIPLAKDDMTYSWHLYQLPVKHCHCHLLVQIQILLFCSCCW